MFIIEILKEWHLKKFLNRINILIYNKKIVLNENIKTIFSIHILYKKSYKPLIYSL